MSLLLLSGLFFIVLHASVDLSHLDDRPRPRPRPSPPRPPKAPKILDEHPVLPQKDSTTSADDPPAHSPPPPLKSTGREGDDDWPYRPYVFEEDNEKLPAGVVVSPTSWPFIKAPGPNRVFYNTSRRLQPATQCEAVDIEKPRDYYERPVILMIRGSPPDLKWFDEQNFADHFRACDVPCAKTTGPQWRYSADVVVHDYTGQKFDRVCPHQYQVRFTMESEAYYPGVAVKDWEGNARSGSYDILATYDWRSDVALNYLSPAWDDIFRLRPRKKRTDAAIFMAISNCGAHNNRLNYLQALNAAGAIVHSYGGCNNNRPQSVYLQDPFLKHIPNLGSLYGHPQKLEIASTYHFVAALENSNAPYYVTEKLGDAFEADAVPIHMGLTKETGIKFFDPSGHALLNAADFKSPEEMAKHILFLIKNETAYNEYKTWKPKREITPWFRYMIDTARPHSDCRMCIRSADKNRWRYGWNHDLQKGNPYRDWNLETVRKASQNALVLRVRPRGHFWFCLIALTERSMANFRQQVKEKFGPFTEHFVTELVRKTAMDPFPQLIETDDQLKHLPPYSELEVTLFYIRGKH